MAAHYYTHSQSWLKIVLTISALVTIRLQNCIYWDWFESGFAQVWEKSYIARVLVLTKLFASEGTILE